MPESYKVLKETVLSVLMWTNRSRTLTVFVGVNALAALTLVFKLSSIFLISVILMTITMLAIFYAVFKQAFASSETPYT